MTSLTTKELSALEDELSAEQLLIKKYQTYAKLVRDPQLQNKCATLAQKHQQHVDSLMGHLN
ncbi:MAG: spore coat protein [Clostridia bacterium]|nr:spore coat protein [Clostridia bacterium]